MDSEISDKLHTAALRACEILIALDPGINTTEGKILDILATAVSEYESVRWPIVSDKIEKRNRDWNWSGSSWFWLLPICRCGELTVSETNYLMCEGCYEYVGDYT